MYCVACVHRDLPLCWYSLNHVGVLLVLVKEQRCCVSFCLVKTQLWMVPVATCSLSCRFCASNVAQNWSLSFCHSHIILTLWKTTPYTHCIREYVQFFHLLLILKPLAFIIYKNLHEHCTRSNACVLVYANNGVHIKEYPSYDSLVQAIQSSGDGSLSL